MATKVELETELDRLKREFEAFRTQVQERIVTAIQEGDICESGGFDALEEFGLEQPTRTFGGYITIQLDVSGIAGRRDRYSDIDFAKPDILDDIALAAKEAVAALDGIASVGYTDVADYDLNEE